MRANLKLQTPHILPALNLTQEVSTRTKGQLREKQACDFLQKNGLKLITKNFRYLNGEIDLIMQKKDEIIFIEVRSKASKEYGLPYESVTPTKQRKIVKTAMFFLQKKNWLNKVNCRFDIISIYQNQLEWFENAFSSDYF
jgi:putative endonuclease